MNGKSTTVGFPQSSKIQSLFNWKKFYRLKSHEKFPAILCFPDFFANSIFAILRWYGYNNDNDSLFCEIYKQIYRFFDILEMLVNLIFDGDITVKPAEEIQNTLREIISKGTIGFEHFCLEWYLKDERSQLNYQWILNETNMKFHGVENEQKLIERLFDEGNCHTRESVSIMPPHSVHYINQTKISNCSELPIELRGPPSWGPIYWNIFHTLPQNASSSTLVLLLLHSVICVLPLIIPCQECSLHYLANVRPSSIEPVHTVGEYETVYNKIHDIITGAK